MNVTPSIRRYLRAVQTDTTTLLVVQYSKYRINYRELELLDCKCNAHNVQSMTATLETRAEEAVANILFIDLPTCILGCYGLVLF